MDKQVSLKFRSTMTSLLDALDDWEKIPEGGDTEAEQLRKKTADLFNKLKLQIMELSL